MDIKVDIERIANGFIVSSDTEDKRFYKNLAEFISHKICEEIDEKDKEFREYEFVKEELQLVFTLKDKK